MSEHASAYAGGAVILHAKMNGQRVWLMQERAAAVGGGNGLSAGGFGNLDALEKQPVGTIMLSVDEVYRELVEELPAAAQMISLEYFRYGAKPLVTFAVRRPDGIHVCAFYAFQLAPSEMEYLMRSSPDVGEVTAIRTMLILPGKEPSLRPHTYVELEAFYPPFHYPHELVPLVALTNDLNGFYGLPMDYPDLMRT